MASQQIFLTIAQLAPNCLVLTNMGDLSDRAEDSNACVRAVHRGADVSNTINTNINHTHKPILSTLYSRTPLDFLFPVILWC